MKKYFLTLIITLTISLIAFAQPDTLWTRTYGGSDDDIGYSVQQTLDGEFIITGYTYSYGAGGSDVYLIKTDDSGNEQWSQTYGGSSYDCGSSVQQTIDGGYIVAGYTASYGAGQSDVYLIKTDEDGNQQWQQTFGGSDYDYGSSVQQTSDGGYIIAGSTISYGAGNYDIYLIKTNNEGYYQWSQTFGGGGDDRGFSVQQTSDEGYIIAGSTISYGAGNSDVYLIKTDNGGCYQWSQTFGGSDEDEGYSVQQTTDGGYIVVGYSASYGNGIGNVFLVKTEANGNQQWQQTYGGNDESGGASVQQTEDGGYIVSGGIAHYDAANCDVYLIKTNADGNQQWSQIFGGIQTEWSYSVQITEDSGYIVTGFTVSFSAGGFDVYLIRLDAEGSLVEDFGKNQPASFTLHPPYPNPFNQSTVIRFDLRSAGMVKLDVFDINGRMVGVQNFEPLQQWMTVGSHEVIFDGSDLSSGIYFAKLTAGDFTQAQKMVLMK